MTKNQVLFMHLRKRHIVNVLKKRAKMFPALGVLGPRQVGKTTFLMKEWTKENNAVYLTFDKQEIALRANYSPEQLLLDESEHLKRHLIVDEAQKVPHIFDSIKAMIDENRRVGAFTLSGSVEFSSKAGIRESMAGRIGLTRLYPMTLREINEQPFSSPWIDLNFTNKLPLSPKSVETWLERGGMPIFCCWGDSEERATNIMSWLETICYRDLQLLKDFKYDPELTLNLLKIIATKSDQLISILRLTELGATSLSIRRHLAALESLFLIYRIPSISNPRAHAMYKLFDAGVINALLDGQNTIFSRHACLVSLVINEIYSQYEYAGKSKPNLYYYRSRGRAEIDLVMKKNDTVIGIECTTSIDISPYKLRGMRSFIHEMEQQSKNVTGYIIAPVQEPFTIDRNIFVIPWNNIG